MSRRSLRLIPTQSTAGDTIIAGANSLRVGLIVNADQLHVVQIAFGQDALNTPHFVVQPPGPLVVVTKGLIGDVIMGEVHMWSGGFSVMPVEILDG